MKAQIITTKDLYEGLRALTGTGSAYAVAKQLGAKPGSACNWRDGKTMDDEYAIKAALTLGLDPDYVLACVTAERAKRIAEHGLSAEHWERIALKLKSAA